MAWREGRAKRKVREGNFTMALGENLLKVLREAKEEGKGLDDVIGELEKKVEGFSLHPSITPKELVGFMPFLEDELPEVDLIREPMSNQPKSDEIRKIVKEKVMEMKAGNVEEFTEELFGNSLIKCLGWEDKTIKELMDNAELGK